MRPYWQVVPLHETTGRTFEPVPPVSRPAFAMKARNSSILSKGTPWHSIVWRVVSVTTPLP